MRHLSDERVEVIRQELQECLPREYGAPSLLAHGGMSLIFVAEHRHLGRRAIKVYPAEAQGSDESFLRARLEGRILARLQHPHIRQMFEFLEGRQHVRALAILQFVEGSDLRTWANPGRPLEERLAAMGQVVDALRIAHENGILHRDIKPQNILVDHAGRAYLCDFGIAFDPEDSRVTRADSHAPFTIQYASPEQLAGLPLDARTDIYSLGVVFFEIVYGVRYRKGIDPNQTNTTAGQPLPAELIRLVDSMLAESPEGRPASCEEIQARLNDATEVTVSVGPTSSSASARRPAAPNRRPIGTARRRSPVRWAVLALFAAASVSVGLVYMEHKVPAAQGRDFGAEACDPAPTSYLFVDLVAMDSLMAARNPDLGGTKGTDSVVGHATFERLGTGVERADVDPGDEALDRTQQQPREESTSIHHSSEPPSRTSVPDNPSTSSGLLTCVLITEFRDLGDPYFIAEPTVRVSVNGRQRLDEPWRAGLRISVARGDLVTIEPEQLGLEFVPRVAEVAVDSDTIHSAFELRRVRSIGTKKEGAPVVEASFRGRTL